MNKEQIFQLINQLKTQFKKGYPNKTDDEIDEMVLDVFLETYYEDKCDKHDLIILAGALGYTLHMDLVDEAKRERKRGNK